MAASQRSRGSTAVPVKLDDEHGGRRQQEEAENKAELRRGPWTVDEDLTLVNYITDNGEGRWNSLARAAGLKRTGKSCRLRWLNYLRPDVKRGKFTTDEQLLILDLHTRWGNRWSKIAQHLPGRTDNEIKNYWRTRVQKHAKQLNCEANSKRFKDAMRYLWMPHLVDVAADDHHHHMHHRHLLQHQHQAAGDLGGAYTAAGADFHALSSGVQAMTSSSDSFASVSFDYEDGGLFANVHADEMLVNGGGGDWAHDGGSQGLWPSSEQPVQQDAGGSQFQDPELSGWVQGFSESITDNFWALEEILKIQ